MIEACLEAFASGDVVAAQDMGAAGLTCSCSEMAAKGGLGVELDLDRVPAREAGMTAYEFLLSESQERMLFVVKAGREQPLMDRFRRWGLQAAVVGQVLEEPIVRVLHHGSVAAEVPATALADDTPIERHELLQEPPAELQQLWTWTEDQLNPLTDPALRCSVCWTIPPLPVSAGCIVSTTSKFWPTRWCPRVRRMLLWFDCVLSRARMR